MASFNKLDAFERDEPKRVCLMRARAANSPDERDAIARVFGEPVAPDDGVSRRIENPRMGVA
jgi:hypothetical protein